MTGAASRDKTGALCQTLLAATGFTNKSLRALIAGLLGSDYHTNQMTYDLRVSGLIRRLPRSNRYMLTDDGTSIATRHVNDYATRARLPRPERNLPQT